jgi:1-acyl-sn-glycerol-3-phosphate acyltransferase
MDLPLSVVVDYLIYAVEQEKEQAAWELWKSLYPFMAIEWLKPIKYEKFKEELFQKQYRYTQKSLEEIEKEMLAVVAKHKGR